jgi:urea transport system permease protein
MFILVTLLLPKGIIGTFNAWWEPWKAQRLAATENAVSAAREDGISEPNPAE